MGCQVHSLCFNIQWISSVRVERIWYKNVNFKELYLFHLYNGLSRTFENDKTEMSLAVIVIIVMFLIS